MPFGRRRLIGWRPFLSRLEIRTDSRFENDIGKRDVRDIVCDARRCFQRREHVSTLAVEHERERFALRMTRDVRRPVRRKLGPCDRRERTVREPHRRTVVMDVYDRTGSARYCSVPYESCSGAGTAAPRKKMISSWGPTSRSFSWISGTAPRAVASRAIVAR